MKFIITGSAGFIGAHLAEYILSINNNNSVIGIDNFYCGSNRKIEQLQDKYGNRFTFIYHNIINPFTELDIFNNIDNIEAIFHLACPASPDNYAANPLFTLDTCYIGTKNVADLAFRLRTKIIFTSTSEIYGDPTETPQTEKYFGNVNCIGPRACYDEGKRVAETLLFEYRRCTGLEIRICRLFNTYGPGMLYNDGRIVSNFIDAIKHNRDIIIYGDGHQTRSFCYISDTVRALYRFSHESINHPGPVNIGNPYCEVSVAQIAADIIEIFGGEYTGQIRHIDARQDDPKMRKPDITLAQKILEWEPHITLREGLKKILDYDISANELVK